MLWITGITREALMQITNDIYSASQIEMKTKTHQIKLMEQFQLCLSLKTFPRAYQMGHFIFAFAMQM